jgi:hypothetical protein
MAKMVKMFPNRNILFRAFPSILPVFELIFRLLDGIGLRVDTNYMI